MCHAPLTSVSTFRTHKVDEMFRDGLHCMHGSGTALQPAPSSCNCFGKLTLMSWCCVPMGALLTRCRAWGAWFFCCIEWTWHGGAGNPRSVKIATLKKTWLLGSVCSSSRAGLASYHLSPWWLIEKRRIAQSFHLQLHLMFATLPSPLVQIRALLQCVSSHLQGVLEYCDLCPNWG